ncbi:MAG: hypothetical protein U1C33_01820 [Candidatus Cloacimonadaceae bacterium]|nr:hypothetical protein [Candidatus Cloacimonadaceae bacterium]
MNSKNLIPIIILVAVIIVLAVLWVNSINKAKALEKEKIELAEAFAHASETIGDIQSSLESLDQDLSGQLFTQGEIPGTSPENRRTQIVNSISNMRKQIETDKQKIADLEKRLAQSGAQLRGVQELLDRLKSSVADKERIVANLQSQLGIMSETLETERKLSAEEIAARDRQLSERQLTIEEQRKDINTIFYVYGTRKELLDKKIIDRKGGLLGIGRVSTVSSQINIEDFTVMNLLDTQTISFPSTRRGYSILTNQNASSFSVDKDGDQNVITITDPNSFRRQKYVVIELL